ncbi:F-box domain-containing protein [Favolaschia claudopus]|uniref:F-box domain-containing protein n=1 Tax=Favolaschia claudopus TaxID=2862362 RepID=A0AAW0AGN0_9AGAR
MSALQASREQLASLDAQIADLERRLVALHHEKCLVQDELDAYKYPVLNLPNEIVSEIFSQTLPPYPICPPISGTLSPTHLTHICSKWREIALSNPQLWRAIRVSFWYNPIVISRRTELVETWIGRACYGPLSIELDIIGIGSAMPQLHSSIFSQRARWEYLKINLNLIDRIFSLTETMPFLRHLELDLNSEPEDGLTTSLILGPAPLLRSAVLAGFAPSFVILPWSQLTSLGLRRAFPEECIPILQCAPNLVHCELHIVTNEDFIPEEIQLLQLESLVITTPENNREEFVVINSFIAPALRRLDISRYQLGMSATDTLTSLFSRSGCSLEELRVTDASPDTTLQYHILASGLPSLTTISVSVRPAGTAMISFSPS